MLIVCRLQPRVAPVDKLIDRMGGGGGVQWR
jgi:hypothetical protein